MEHSTMRVSSKHGRRRMRRLGGQVDNVGTGDEVAKKRSKRGFWQKLKPYFYILIFLTLACAVLFGHHLTQNNAKQRGLLQDFLHTYRQQYYNILHGQLFYCDPELDSQKLFAQIRTHQILHQEPALQQLKVLLHNVSDHNSIALVGPSGVGKSMFARALHEYFPWRENIHYYVWNTHVSDEAQKFRMLRLFISRFTECGRNLLIIDNLSPCDRELIPLLQHLLETRADTDNKRIILIYIFNLNVLMDEIMYQQKLKALQSLPNTVTVNFQPINKEALRDCVYREAKLQNVTIDETAMQEILETVDPFSSGCKNVHAKVLVHGVCNTQMINVTNNA